MNPVTPALLFLILLISNFCFAQNNNVGIGTLTPNPSALLDVDASPANNKGVLVPRLNSMQMNSIPTPANGLIVYNTDSLCFCYFNSSAWKSLCNTGGSTVLPGTGTSQNVIVLSGGGITFKNTPLEGVVLIDANNQCWKLSVDITGKLTTQSVTCP